MKSLKINKYRVFIVSAFLWLAIDLISKYFAMTVDLSSIVFIKNFFYLTFQTNRGIAFGILLPYAIQIITSIAILGLLVYFGFKYILAPNRASSGSGITQKKNAFLNQFLLGIIIGGALGNLINRIYLGYVIDFIVLRSFPVFNIADIGITVGLIVLFFLNFETEKS